MSLRTMTAALSVVAAVGSVARAGVDGDLAVLLPAATVSYVGCADAKPARDQFDRTGLGALVKDGPTKSFFGQVRKQLSDDLAASLGCPGTAIQGLFDHCTGWAVADVLTAPDRSARTLLLRLPDVADAKASLEQFKKVLADRAPQRSEATVRGVAVVRHQAGTDKPPAVYFVKGDLVCIANDGPLAEAILERTAAGGSQDRLAADPAYLHVSRRAAAHRGQSPPPHLQYFVSVKNSLATADKVEVKPGRGYRRNTARTFVDLGFDGVQALGGTVDFGADGAEAVGRVALYGPPPYRALLTSLGFARDDPLAPPAWVPANVDAYFAGNVNFGQFKQHVGRLIDSGYGAGLTEFYDVLKEDLRKDETFGVDIDKDFFDQLGPRVDVVSRIRPSADANNENSCLALDATDPDKLKAAFAKLLRNRPEVKTSTPGGATVWEFPPPAALDRAKRGAAKTDPGPAVAIHGRTLLVASHADFLAELLPGAAARPALAADPDYRRVSAAVAKAVGKPPALHCFIRTRNVLRVEHEHLTAGKPRSTFFGQLVKRLDQSELGQLSFPPFDRFHSVTGPVGLQLIPEENGWFGVVRVAKVAAAD